MHNKKGNKLSIFQKMFLCSLMFLVWSILYYFSPIHTFFSLKNFLLGFSSGFGVLVVNYFISRAITVIRRKENVEYRDYVSPKISKLFDSTSIIIVINIFVAITEEYVFRSYLLSYTNSLFPISLSIAINSIIFYLAHLNSKIVELIIMAITFSLITIYTDNMLTPIIAHITNNVLSVLYKKKLSIRYKKAFRA